MGEQRLEDYLDFNISFLDSHVLPIHGTITLVNAGVTAAIESISSMSGA